MGKAPPDLDIDDCYHSPAALAQKIDRANAKSTQGDVSQPAPVRNQPFPANHGNNRWYDPRNQQGDMAEPVARKV
jgi:hypothetical protein